MEKSEKIQSLTENGIFHIFAIDHRDVLTVQMEAKAGPISDENKVLNEKLRLISAVDKQASAVLVDTHYFFHDRKLDPRMQMEHVLVGIERNNYDISKIGDGYLTEDVSIRELAESGCRMVKLFVYYHPDMAFTDEIDKVIGYAAEECKKYQLPLMLEPILYQPEPERRLELTRRMLTRLKKFDIDIYKIEFPGDLAQYTDSENLAICKEISELLKTPWIILSSGISLQDFKKQLEISGKGGSCGYAVGRSVWNPFILENDLENMKQVFAQIKSTAAQYCQSCSL